MNRYIDSLRVRRNAYRHKGVDARRKDAVIVVVVVGPVVVVGLVDGQGVGHFGATCVLRVG